MPADSPLPAAQPGGGGATAQPAGKDSGGGAAVQPTKDVGGGGGGAAASDASGGVSAGAAQSDDDAGVGADATQPDEGEECCRRRRGAAGLRLAGSATGRRCHRLLRKQSPAKENGTGEHWLLSCRLACRNASLVVNDEKRFYQLWGTQHEMLVCSHLFSCRVCQTAPALSVLTRD